MQWLAKRKISTKLILGFATMLVFMLAIGGMGHRSINKINHELEDIFAKRLPSIDYLIEADRDLQQLLVAERTMLFTETGSALFKELEGEYEQNMQQAETRFNRFSELAATPEEQAIIAQYGQAREKWLAATREVVKGIQAGSAAAGAARELSLGAAKARFEQMRDYIDQLTEINLALAEKASKQAGDTYQAAVAGLVAIIGFGLLAGIFLVWAINRGVSKPLRVVIDGLTRASDQVSAGSRQLAASSQSLAEGSSEQAASIEETSSSLEEMSSMTKQNADNADQADRLMKEANLIVKEANDSMVDLTASMQDISKASEETSKIIKTIDEIAFQTNLLALNAAVEAARAGEAGAGFAVVADEVRNLAMRAADAARNTAELIETTVSKTQDGTELVVKTNEVFGSVAESAAKVGELVGEIAAASNEQSQGIGQVNTAVIEMDKVVQQNAATSEESASASEEMSAQAEEMKRMVGDLVALVEGRSKADPASSATKQAAVNPGKRPLPKERARNAAAAGSAKAEKAAYERIIPMDDDFEDF